jgi:UPF0042 nucleotide-binding protein
MTADSPEKRVYIISGISGAGKSQALKCFEDFGFYCVDNLPIALLPSFVELLEKKKEMDRVALGIDIRAGQSLKELSKALRTLREHGFSHRVIFLDAADDILVQRYSETRHRHPLGQTPAEAIHIERKKLVEIKAMAAKVIDTSNMTLGELKEALSATLELKRTSEMMISIESFGYKHGLPIDADIVMDVRFLPNPNYVPGLKAKTGLDAKVADYLREQPMTNPFIEDYDRLLRRLLPQYVKEGKSYLTVAVGCTGGRHRSVYVTHELARRLHEAGFEVREYHRDMDK